MLTGSLATVCNISNVIRQKVLSSLPLSFAHFLSNASDFIFTSFATENMHFFYESLFIFGACDDVRAMPWLEEMETRGRGGWVGDDP